MEETTETLDESILEAFTSPMDPNGSYTGTPDGGDDFTPEQDADDL
jgi:hypothetical protein